MRVAPSLVVVLMAIPLSLAGCLGVGDEGVATASDRTPLKSAAEVTVSTGGIQGLVTDAAIVPIEGATVSLPDLGLSTVVAEDGSYAFSLLKPGLYTMVAIADGHNSDTKEVNVKAEVVSAADFILTQIAEQVPYVDLLEFKGFQECASLTGWNLTKQLPASPVPTPVIRDYRYFFLGVTWCSIPNIVAENSTNDKFLFTYHLNVNAKGIVHEFEWQPSQALASSMVFPVEAEGISNDDRVTFAEPAGKSPLRGEVSLQRMAEVDEALKAECEDEEFPPSSPDYCRASYVEVGGEIQVRAFPWFTDCQTPEGFACANFQQAFTVLGSLFYNAPPPAGYKLLK